MDTWSDALLSCRCKLASICFYFLKKNLLAFVTSSFTNYLLFGLYWMISLIFFLSNMFICLSTINEKKWYCCQLIMSFYKWLDGITNHWISFWFNLKSNVVYVIPFFLVLSVYAIHGYLTTFFGIFVDFLCKSKDVIWSNQMNARRKLLDHSLCLISSCIVWVADVRFISFSNDFSIWICY
jgi:hypothetical protein